MTNRYVTKRDTRDTVTTRDGTKRDTRDTVTNRDALTQERTENVRDISQGHVSFCALSPYPLVPPFFLSLACALIKQVPNETRAQAFREGSINGTHDGRLLY